MKRLNLQGSVVVTALLAFYAGGCVSEIAPPIIAKETARTAQGTTSQAQSALDSDLPKPRNGETKTAPGFVVHIDPVTGEFLPEPNATGVATEARQANDSTQAPGLYFKEVQSPTLGGGVMVDLQGQFQTPLVATIDADGNVTMKHEPTMPMPESEHK